MKKLCLFLPLLLVVLCAGHSEENDLLYKENFLVIKQGTQIKEYHFPENKISVDIREGVLFNLDGFGYSSDASCEFEFALRDINLQNTFWFFLEYNDEHLELELSDVSVVSASIDTVSAKFALHFKKDQQDFTFYLFFPVSSEFQMSKIEEYK